VGNSAQIKVAKKIAFNVGVLSCIGVLTFAQIDGRIAPFAMAFLFACLYIRCNRWVMGAGAFLFSLFVGHSQHNIISAAVAVSIFFVLVYGMEWLRFKKVKFQYGVVGFAYVMTHVANVIFANGAEEIFTALVGMLVGGVFLAACLVFINAMRTRFNKIPWTIDQKICAGVFVMILSLGIGGLHIDYFSIHKFVTTFLILCAAIMLDARSTFIIAICMGLGLAFLNLDLTPIAVYGLYALVAVSFKIKYMAVVAVMMIELVLGFYFRVYFHYNVFDFLPVAVACLLVLILPGAMSKYFDFSRGILNGYLVSKNTINRNRQGVNKRLENLSGVFNEMQNIYKNLVRGSLPPEETSRMLARNLADNVCDRCENRPNCRRDVVSSEQVNESFEKLCYVGLQRGSVNFLDISPDMSIKCTKLNAVLNTANNYITQTHSQSQSRGRMDASKILMAGLLSGLSRLCQNFAIDLGSEVVFDTDKAVKIKDALLTAGVVASDCLITKNGRGEYHVSVLVSRNDSHNRGIEKAISKIVMHKMQVESIDDAETAGFSIVTVKTAPRYNLTFGIAQVSKDFNPHNGDSFSFLKVTSDRTMMALCDGMGAGQRAKRASTLAISLIENFYKAGFSHEIIMESVNQLLIITEQEDFSAIDIAVFSLNDGMVNFIKVGGVEGFIKRDREVEVIEAGSLPMGIVEEMVPKITRAHLVKGDMVILVSDGVTESFNDRAALASFINNSTATVPQNLADEIVAECLNRTDRVAIDDCSVVIARLD